MNKEIFTMINELAGQSQLTDTIIVFCASYFIYVLAGIVLALLATLSYKRQWRSIIFFSANVILTLVALYVISKFYTGARPLVSDANISPLVQNASSWFPSIYATLSVAAALGVTVFTKFKFIGLILIIAACLISFARIAAGANYPLDIFYGFSLGLVMPIVGGIIYHATNRKQSSVKFDSHK